MELRVLEAIDLARRAAGIASDKQASDIIILDTRGVCNFADYFVICTGESERQLTAITEEIQHALKKEGVLPRHREGTADSGWVLLDYGDVIIHVFGAEERGLYDLDNLWASAKTVLRLQ